MSQQRDGLRNKRILFVAPSSCGQIQITRYFWEFYAPEGIEASFAALETNPIDPWLNTAMREYDLVLDSEEVTSLFVLSTTSNQFDWIVSLGSFQHYSTLSPFMETLDILFGKSPKRISWEIEDPSEGNGTKADLIDFAEGIRNRIEFEVAQLAQSLEESG